MLWGAGVRGCKGNCAGGSIALKPRQGQYINTGSIFWSISEAGDGASSLFCRKTEGGLSALKLLPQRDGAGARQGQALALPVAEPGSIPDTPETPEHCQKSALNTAGCVPQTKLIKTAGGRKLRPQTQGSPTPHRGALTLSRLGSLQPSACFPGPPGPSCPHFLLNPHCLLLRHH